MDVCRKTLYSEIGKINHKTLKAIYESGDMILMTTYYYKVTQSLYIKDILDF